MSIIAIKERLEQSPLIQQILGQNKEKYILSVLSEISKTANDDKKDLTKCTPDSIISAIKQACDLRLEIDGRQHCHLVKFNKKIQVRNAETNKIEEKYISEAQLQVGYRGFIYAIKRAYVAVNIDCRLVHEGDIFTLKKEGDTTTYSLEIKDPFAKRDKILGGFCYISYKLGDRLVSFCETMSIDEIKKIQGCAKQDFIWKDWFEEKAKVAIIKRACKVHFSGINEDIAKIEEFDNQEYDLSKDPKVINEEESAPIDSEKLMELENLLKLANISKEDFMKVYNLENFLDFPEPKFEDAKNRLEKKAKEVQGANS